MRHIKHDSKTHRTPCRATLTLSAILLLTLTGCASGRGTVYVNDSSAVVPVTEGETAKATGLIISPGALADLMQCCSDNLDTAEE